MPESPDIASSVARTREYYDGPADEIYRLIWGDNIHLGVPCNDACPHPEAMEHTNEIMAKLANLDIGCSLGCSKETLVRLAVEKLVDPDCSEGIPTRCEEEQPRPDNNQTNHQKSGVFRDESIDHGIPLLTLGLRNRREHP